MKKILLSHKNNETRVAIIENGELLSFYDEREDNPQLVGNIYKGVIQNFLPGMQAAFIDIDRDKNAFLQLGKKQKFHIGQSILIQIEKEAIGTKGPRATINISIPGHQIVLLPMVNYIGISHKINGEERDRLFKIAKKIRPEGMGIIIRTAAESCDEDTLKAELNNLVKLWQYIAERIEKKKSPSLIYSDNDLITRIVRDDLTNDVDCFLIDNLKIYKQVIETIKNILPEFTVRVEYYEDNLPIFEQFNIDSEIKKLGQREIELPSGSCIIIDKTEALTVIDVNTGKFVGSENLSDTIYKTNIEAAEVILKQLNLRDIGGIIIVDFIDMNRDEQKNNLLEFLREGAKKDRRKINIVDMTPLGLVEITRKRSRQS